MFKPDPKPVKQEKTKMTSYEFRKYGGAKSLRKYGSQRKVKKVPPKHSFYKSTAWKWFARYIKLLYANMDGYVRCQTSGQYFKLGDKNLHAGHCIRVFDANSTNYATAFDERNVMPQSYSENKFYGGRPEVMRDKIDKKFGAGTYEELKVKSKNPVFFIKSDYKEIADKYRVKTNELLKEKRLIKWW